MQMLVALLAGRHGMERSLSLSFLSTTSLIFSLFFCSVSVCCISNCMLCERERESYCYNIGTRAWHARLHCCMDGGGGGEVEGKGMLLLFSFGFG
jgi:hypothetical protein